MDDFLPAFPAWVWAVFLVGMFGTGWAILRAARYRKLRPPARNRRTGRSVVGQAIAQTPPLVSLVTYAQVNEECLRRRKRWMDWSGRIDQRLGELEGRLYESMSPELVLGSGTAEERANLATILGLPSPATEQALAEALRKAGSHSLASLIRGGHVSYEEVVADVAVRLGAARPSPGAAAATVERVAIAAALEHMLSNASPSQRTAILAELARSQTSSSTALATATGAVVVANLTGFGLYMAASSALAAVTGAIGLTLPFAIYTGMSSVLATVAGPVGWAVLAAWAVVRLGSADHKKTIPGVIAIAAVRARLIAERDQEIGSLKKEKEIDLAAALVRINALADFAEQMRGVGPDHSVPKDSVPW
jgi:uncharacterized protein YaaW (UPF0174 family)